MKYQKTKDPNIIKQIEIIENEIDLDKLKQQITDLENIKYNFLQYPKDATVAMKQAVDEYNEPEIACQLQNEAEMEEKRELLNKCKEAK